MKIVAIISILFCSMNSLAQIVDNINEFNVLALETKREIVINQLKTDTMKYSKEDTYHTAFGTINNNSYSQLFVINGMQYIKFDIVDGNCVIEFIDKYLKKSNLKSIKKLNQTESSALYGTNGKNGVVIITLRKLKKAKTTNCGFIETEKGNGSNLDQWKEGDVRIRNHGILIKEK